MFQNAVALYVKMLYCYASITILRNRWTVCMPAECLCMLSWLWKWV